MKDTEERLAQVLTSADAVPVVRQLSKTRMRSVVFLTYADTAALLVCAQKLLHVKSLVYVAYGWWATNWYAMDVDLGLQDGITDSTGYHAKCTRDEMINQVDSGSLFIMNHMDWHPNPSTNLKACGMPTTTAGQYRKRYEDAAMAQGEIIATEAGTFSDAVCMFAIALRQLIDKGYTASQMKPSKTLFHELQVPPPSSGLRPSVGPAGGHGIGEGEISYIYI